MKSSKVILAAAVALSACKHTGATTSDATAKSEEMDAGTSSGMSMSADAGNSSSMSMSADAGTASSMAMSSDAGMSSSASTGATTASDAAKSAAANGSAGTSSITSSASSADAGTASAQLSDAQIAGITAAAHQSEIDAAKMARSHSKNAKVRSFAAKMIKEHTAAMKEEQALNLSPADSDQASKIKSDASQLASKLDGIRGRDFDKQYAQAMVDGHQQVLDMIDNTLIPAAQDAKLKAQLQKERPVVASHLEHAQKLAADLGAK